MNNRPVLTVLFVALCWLSVGTYALTTTVAPVAVITIAPVATATPAPAAVTTPAATTTTAPAAVTTPAATTAPAAVTTPAATTTPAPTAVTTSAATATPAPTAVTTPAATTTPAPTAVTTSAATTTPAPTAVTATTTPAPTAVTTSAATTTPAPTAVTTSAATTTPAPTAVTTSAPAATTTAAPLVQNTTVEILATDISRAGCGSQALCAAQPAGCDPASGSCFFLSAKQISGNNFEFGLAGDSAGYVAATLSTDATLGGDDTTYVCANNNGVVKFVTTVLNNGVLTETPLNANSVKGKVTGNKIQCTFAATVPTTSQSRTIRSTRASNLAIAVSTGSFNATSGALGSPRAQIKTGVVDLANANATVTNSLTNTTSNAITLRQSLSQAVLITMGVLGLTVL